MHQIFCFFFSNKYAVHRYFYYNAAAAYCADRNKKKVSFVINVILCCADCIYVTTIIIHAGLLVCFRKLSCHFIQSRYSNKKLWTKIIGRDQYRSISTKSNRILVFNIKLSILLLHEIYKTTYVLCAFIFYSLVPKICTFKILQWFSWIVPK